MNTYLEQSVLIANQHKMEVPSKLPDRVVTKVLQSKTDLSTPSLTPPLSHEDSSENSVTDTNFSIPLPPPTTIPTQILDIDLKTPDSHVPRDPRLIRLTGIHPFNVEAPLSDLYNEGFLTSPELFFVRNHGPVPRITDKDIATWELIVEGLVEKPLTISLNQIMTEYDVTTRAITLVCAGNRRKEQNMVRQSKGFNWGAAGLSTALFTGVNMADIIRAARPKHGARYVCMEGADVLPNGHYGTSVKLSWVLDVDRGFMLAWKMNGQMLRLDHGRPLRVVIPGMIGGRSVKWLKKMTVTDRPSENWYHIYDNRVLPTMVSPNEASKNEEWWKDERYAIYDLNVNSAIVYPAHGELLGVRFAGESYRARGYAYTGGGRRVTRVEVSLDQGRTWRLADIEYAEDRYHDVNIELYGGRLDLAGGEASFCWCFWSISIPISELTGSKDLIVRSMDDSMNVQPRDMYWSVLGMMNNPWFRVVIHREGDSLTFEHPTQPATIPGGWMERAKREDRDVIDGHWGETQQSVAIMGIRSMENEVSMVKRGKPLITINELLEHRTEDNPWFVVEGEVYDGSRYLDEHPGGAVSITAAAGSDATEDFMAIHSETARAMMKDFHIGTLDGVARVSLLQNGTTENQITTSDNFLTPRSWRKAVLLSKRAISWNTRIFTFKLDNPDQAFGVPVGKHLLVRLRDSNARETLIRPYTPISDVNNRGEVELLVKVYFGDGNTKRGRMSRTIDALAVGGTIEMKGPFGKFEYLGHGRCQIGNSQRKVRKFVMICGGSGITPILQVFRAVIKDAQYVTECILFDGNRTEEDILCRQELDALVNGSELKCKIVHTLTDASTTWSEPRGQIDAKLIREYCTIDDDTIVLICGPEEMERDLKIGLIKYGWTEDQLMFF
jgi:nitrate reductase (NAD(P)H)